MLNFRISSISLFIFLSISLSLHQLIGFSVSIDDTVTIDTTDGVTGTSLIEYQGEYNGENIYAYTANVPATGNVNFSFNATAITGNPKMEITMFNVNDNSQHYYTYGNQEISLGENVLTWTNPHALEETLLKFSILVDSDDSITIDSFDVSESPSILLNGPINVAYENVTGIEHSFGWLGEWTDPATNINYHIYGYKAFVPANYKLQYTIDANSVTGDPRMEVSMFNGDNLSEFWTTVGQSTLQAGINNFNWNPVHPDRLTFLEFKIVLDANDSVDMNSFSVQAVPIIIPGSEGSGVPVSVDISDTFTIDTDNGVVGTTVMDTLGPWGGYQQYGYTTYIEKDSGVSWSFNVSELNNSNTPTNAVWEVTMWDPDDPSAYWYTHQGNTPIVSGLNTINWRPVSTSTDVHLKFSIKLAEGTDTSVEIDSFNVYHTLDHVVSNGVQFKFENAEGPNPAYQHFSETVEITGNEFQEYYVNIPAYTAGSLFEAVILEAVGDTAIVIKDMAFNINDGSGNQVYGGPGTDTLYFDRTFFGTAYQASSTEGEHYYQKPEEANGAFLLNENQRDNVLPSNGISFDNGATITFSAALSDVNLDLPPLFTGGEAAIGNGTIDFSGDTGLGRGDEPPYKWKPYAVWYDLSGEEGQGSYVGEAPWSRLTELPATWDNTGSIVTLAPNSDQYSKSSDFQGFNNDTNENDGAYYFEQIVAIEGDRNTSELLGKVVTFSGEVLSDDLHSRYDVVAFVKAVNPNSGANRAYQETTLSSTGEFVVTANIPEGDFIPSVGFVLKGRNVDPDSETDWGSIQIGNLNAFYDVLTPIQEGNFTDGANGYWAATSVQGTSITFDESSGGYGPQAGQLLINNPYTDRGQARVFSNNNIYETLDSFGLVAGNTYDITYYMNRESGNDLGFIMFAIYDETAGGDGWLYFPNSYSANVHGDANPTNGTWVQYTQSLQVPVNATFALMTIVSGAESEIAFDQINISNPTNTFANWADSYGLQDDDSLYNADPDSDGVINVIENFYGTNPNDASAVVSVLAKENNVFSMEHPINSNVIYDVSATYEWSSDLERWYSSGESVGNSTVTIAHDDITNPGVRTTSATVAGDELDKIFIKLSVANEDPDTGE